MYLSKNVLLNKAKNKIDSFNDLYKIQKKEEGWLDSHQSIDMEKFLIKKELKTNHGVTLIALVITIIVLLILAGVSIASLSGENGILNKASESRNQSDIEDIKAKAKLEIMQWQTQEGFAGRTTELTDDVVKNVLESKGYTFDGYDIVVTIQEREYKIPVSSIYK